MRALLILVILVSLLLAGCATTTNEQQFLLNNYVGKNIDEFMIERNLTPLKSEDLSSGGKFYKFREAFDDSAVTFWTTCDYSLITNLSGIITKVVNAECGAYGRIYQEN